MQYEVLKAQLYVLRRIVFFRPCAHLAFLAHAPYRAMYDNMGQNVELAESLGEWVNLEHNGGHVFSSIIAFRYTHNRGAIYYHPRIPCVVLHSLVTAMNDFYLAKFLSFRSARKNCICKSTNPICQCKVVAHGSPIIEECFFTDERGEEDTGVYIETWKNITKRWNAEKRGTKKQITHAEQMQLESLIIKK